MQLSTLLLVLLISLNYTLAQEKVIEFNGEPKETGAIDIRDWTYFYEDHSKDALPLSIVQRKEFKPFFRKRDERGTKAEHSVLKTWLRFTILNSNPQDSLKLYFTCGVHRQIDAYLNHEIVGEAGIAEIPNDQAPEPYALLLRIPPGQQHTYYIRILNKVVAVTPISATLYSEEGAFRKAYREAKEWSYLFLAMAIICGCLLFMFIYATFNWFLTSDKAFFYYACYVLISLYLIFLSTDLRFSLDILPVKVLYYPELPTPTLLIIFYGLFISHILEIKSQKPKVWKGIRLLLCVLAVQWLYDEIESFFSQPFFHSNLYYLYSRIPAAITLFIFLFLILKSKSPVKFYLSVGVISLIFLFFLPMIFDLYFPNLPPRFSHFLNYMGFPVGLGLTIENICFALALAYRGRLIELEKNQLQKNYTHQLEEELEARTREVEKKNLEMEEQHLRELEISFQQKLARTEMGALRAQMNPHFIFNSLNSIKLFAIENKGPLAADYLTKFAKLIRLVLENSQNEKISLEEELEALSLYMEMELIRFNEKLTYEIKVQETIDLSFIEIPPLLIQPFVENAIWHGLMHKPEGGKVTIDVQQKDEDILVVKITDDGIGRAKAMELNSKSTTKHKSFGMKMTNERIQLTNQLFNSKTEIIIHDLVLPSGEPCGTEVIVSIPF